MGDKPTDAQRVAKLEQLVTDQARTILHMQRMGGFADAKTLGTRCTRIEERLALVELDGEMLKDVAAHTTNLIGAHLKDRHAIDVDRDEEADSKSWRHMRRRLREWAEKRGLMTRRRDVTDTRHDENRTRPRQAVSA